ncbi:MAG: methyl-accepting chemotaxis protein [Deltaproteobacteria bacterium]|nr:methyl-accepting chemotaxis protein [Deltaproteobacteria bacterium]TLN04168.1 MAG: methyl-accepting chemotaxis protein [bacterium]
MKIKTKLIISSCICSAGIIGIACFSLVTILMIKDKITVMTTQSTPLQVKTVQLQQLVEKLSADLLQLGLSRDTQEVSQVSAAIDMHRDGLEKIHQEISEFKDLPLDMQVFSDLHDQVLRAVDEKFKAMAVFREEAGRVNGAMARVDKSLEGLKEIIASIQGTASRRSSIASKSLSSSISEKSSVAQLMDNIENYRNEVVDIELNKKIQDINVLVYNLGVDSKLLDAKARTIMLSESSADLDRRTAEVRAIEGRILGNITRVAAAVQEIKSSGYIDETMTSIKNAAASGGASLRTIAVAQRKVLESMSQVESSVERIKEVSLEQSRRTEENVASTAREQQDFVSLVEQRVELFKRLLIGFSLTVIVLVLVLSFKIIGSVLRPLSGLTDTIVTIAKTGDFSKVVHVERTDEIGVTQQGFNSLIVSFKQIISAIFSSSAKLSDCSRELTSAAADIHNTIENQSARISQVAAASLEMAQTVTLISTNTVRIADSAAEARSIATEGSAIVDQAGSEVAEIARVAEESTLVLRKLSERSQQVGEIVDVIEGITDQINLLALNAAIEAARAGEAGLGFAVVAGEVRKLADNTATATVGITELIKAIQSDTEVATAAMKRSLERVQKGVEYSAQAGSSLRRIVESVEMFQGMTREIAQATDGLSVTAEKISSDINEIDFGAAVAVQSVRSVAAQSDSLKKLSEELMQKIERFSCSKNVSSPTGNERIPERNRLAINSALPSSTRFART